MINTTFHAQGTNFQTARQNLGLPQEVQVAEPKDSLIRWSGGDPGQTNTDKLTKGLAYAKKHASVVNYNDFESVAPQRGAPTEAAAERVQLFGNVSGHEPVIVAGHGTMVAATIIGGSADLDHLKAPTLSLSADGSETVVSVQNGGSRIQLRDADAKEDAKASILVGENNQGTLNFHNGDSVVKVALGEFSQDSPLVGEDGLMSHLPNGPISFMAVSDHSIEAKVNGSRFYVDRQDGGEWRMSDISSPG